MVSMAIVIDMILEKTRGMKPYQRTGPAAAVAATIRPTTKPNDTKRLRYILCRNLGL